MRFISFFIALLLVALPVSAQQKYSTWSNPDSSGSGNSEQTRQLVDKLNALIDEAEKSRAADPVFLKDLRDLARSYDNPWRTSVLNDDFTDGDFTANPVWTVSEGRYWVEKDWGLRSAVTVQPESAPQQQTGKSDGKDVALALLGAVLKQATKNKGGSTTSAPAEPQLAAIHSAAALSNAFSIEFEISSWQSQGRIDIGPYQGTNINSGYRLSYTPGGALALLRSSARGTSIVQQSANAVTLEDQKPHVISWTRDQGGKMTVAVDGKTVLSASDRGFNDPFQGIAIANRGGDYIFKRITVRGIK